MSASRSARPAETAFIASVDVGSSAVKAVLVSVDGGLHRPRSVGYPARSSAPGEQDPGEWWQAFVAVLRAWWSEGVAPASIIAITFSGQMQDLIVVDDHGEPVRPAVLYSDSRAAAAAQAIERRLGAESIVRVTRNPFNAGSVLPKMLHLREHEPNGWARTARVLFGAKDFITLRLTGRAVTDPATAATTGVFDLEGGCWAADWLAPLGLDVRVLPELRDGGMPVGGVSAQAATSTGLAGGTPVLCGLGDAAATTLGAGIVDASQCYAYLGTSGWVATVSAQFAAPGAPLFVLPYLAPDRRILVGPVSNAGGVHRWALELLAGSADSANDDARYAAFEREVAAAPNDERLLFLPYLASERLPVFTDVPRGTFTGLSARTTRAQMMRATIEGVSLSLRWAFDVLQARAPRELVVVGGATRSAAWMQTLADAFDTTLRIPPDAEFLPCVGAASVAAVTLGWCRSPEAFVQRRGAGAARCHEPNPVGAAMLRRKSTALRALLAAVAGLPRSTE